MKNIILTSALLLISILFWECNSKQEQNQEIDITTIEPTYKIVLASEVEWTHLNPKRGDLAPKAGTLWGNRNGNEPTGFLLKPNDGFKSPPHIHNVSYRGIVINGLFHNDDPSAADLWMSQCSFWTQPKGEIHITAAEGSNSLAYVEIEEGPYLVNSEEEHFDSGERPINIEKSNIVWMATEDLNWKRDLKFTNDSRIAFLWGKPISGELNGTFLSLPPQFEGKLVTQDSEFRAVVIKGNLQYNEPSKEIVTNLTPGSLFSSEKKSYHTLSNTSDDDVVVYVRSYGLYQIV